MRFRSCAALIALIFALLGAGSAGAVQFVDSAGRRVELPAQIQRIMPAGPASAVFVYVLVPNKLIGWPEPLSPAQRALLPARYRRLPTIGQLGGPFPTATADDVERLHPDLIIGYGVINPPTIALANRIQQQTHVPYLLIDDSIQVMPQMIRALSPLLGAGSHGDEVGTYTFSAVALLRGQLLIVPADKRPLVYYGRGPDGLETPLPGSAAASVLEQAGAINAAEGLGRGIVAPVTRDQLFAWNPQIIIAQQRSFYNSLLHSRQWAGLAATARKRVYLEPGAPFGWIDDPPGLNRVIGLYWLSSLFRQLEALVRPAENPEAASKQVANVPIFGAEPPPMPGTPPNPELALPPAGPPAGPPGRGGIGGGSGLPGPVPGGHGSP
jgi:iron complex transport system substrate-binding protein